MKKTQRRKKLTPSQVKNIRAMVKSGKKQLQVAKKFGVSAACVCRVIARQRHKNV